MSNLELGETSEEKPWIRAATTLLVRDGEAGLEVFLMVRHENSRSFSGAAVSWKTFFMANLLPVTLGNIVGGAVAVAAVFSFMYGKLGK